jgi:hypothetical protein
MPDFSRERALALLQRAVALLRDSELYTLRVTGVSVAAFVLSAVMQREQNEITAAVMAARF